MRLVIFVIIIFAFGACEAEWHSEKTIIQKTEQVIKTPKVEEEEHKADWRTSHPVLWDSLPCSGLENLDYCRVVSYRFEGRSGGHIIEKRKLRNYKNHDETKTVPSLHYSTILPGQAMTETQIKTLVKLVEDDKSYGYYNSACYDPRWGVVFYDDSSKVLEQVNICFECNQLGTTMDVEVRENGKNGMQPKVRKKLWELCVETGACSGEYQEY